MKAKNAIKTPRRSRVTSPRSVLKAVQAELKALSGDAVSIEKMAEMTGLPENPVSRALDILTERGVIATIPGSGGKYFVPYPKETPAHEEKQPVEKKLLGRDKMWRVMRAKRRFTRIDIKRIAELPISSVETYFDILLSHGYIRKTGKTGNADVFMLVKNPGPIRPILKKLS